MTWFLWSVICWFTAQASLSVMVLWRRCLDDSDEARGWLVYRTIVLLCEASFAAAAWGLLP